MRRTLFLIFSICLAAIPVQAGDGMITVTSDFTVTETADRLEQILKE